MTWAVAIARQEVHRRIDTCRVFPQCVVHDTHGLDKLTPIHSAQEKRRLPMLLLTVTWSAACCWLARLHQLFYGLSCFRKMLFNPCER